MRERIITWWKRPVRKGLSEFQRGVDGQVIEFSIAHKTESESYKQRESDQTHSAPMDRSDCLNLLLAEQPEKKEPNKVLFSFLNFTPGYGKRKHRFVLYHSLIKRVFASTHPTQITLLGKGLARPKFTIHSNSGTIYPCIVGFLSAWSWSNIFLLTTLTLCSKTLSCRKNIDLINHTESYLSFKWY